MLHIQPLFEELSRFNGNVVASETDEGVGLVEGTERGSTNVELRQARAISQRSATIIAHPLGDFVDLDHDIHLIAPSGWSSHADAEPRNATRAASAQLN
jgi:hypothetical protein